MCCSPRKQVSASHAEADKDQVVVPLTMEEWVSVTCCLPLRTKYSRYTYCCCFSQYCFLYYCLNLCWLFFVLLLFTLTDNIAATFTDPIAFTSVHSAAASFSAAPGNITAPTFLCCWCCYYCHWAYCVLWPALLCVPRNKVWVASTPSQQAFVTMLHPQPAQMFGLSQGLIHFDSMPICFLLLFCFNCATYVLTFPPLTGTA